MDLMTNCTFRIHKTPDSSAMYASGIYRVILDCIQLKKTVAVLISPDEECVSSARGGRRKKPDAVLKQPRKKPSTRLRGDLIWMDRIELQRLSESNALTTITIERNTPTELNKRSQQLYERRKRLMAPFLDIERLQKSILDHESLGDLVKCARAGTNASHSFVYKLWSLLCERGLDESSLIPRHDRCGAPGVRRLCESAPGGRKKAGRKTLKQRISLKHGTPLDPEQPGVSAEWSAKIRAADKRIPCPKPQWADRCVQIINSAFCSKAKEENGKLVLISPEIGTYPNNRQIIRVLTEHQTKLERLIERTTKRFFISAKRGLKARNWEGVSGPGHTYAIDSTIGDIYLRSSVNRAWIVGRPIVYVIIDIWSTAIVGFYVCLTGPSWNTAKVSLFNTGADPALVSGLWGYQPILNLEPFPTLCYALLCDRGEYLSKGHRATAVNLLKLTSYTPPYRGDLKGLVEVIHRIEKDKQFLFVPGAIDHRRAELELRRVDPSKCILTVREYVHYLYEIFCEYNLTADRNNRMDAQLRSDDVVPSPAGLWNWGHTTGIGYRKYVEFSDLATQLLPSVTGRVRRDAVRHAGCDYSSPHVIESQWTALARNFGGWDIPVHYYPGAMSTIWTPNAGGAGMLQLQLSDQSKASPELTLEEWQDVCALETVDGPDNEHRRLLVKLQTRQNVESLRDNASRATAEAIAKSSGKAPSFTEARAMEVAAYHPSQSEEKAIEELQEEAMQDYHNIMDKLLMAKNKEMCDDEI